MLKNLTIGKKIGAGFGVVMSMLVVVILIGFFGTGLIVKKASDMISGEELIAEINKGEIEHLNWMAKLNSYMNDVSIKELKIQTDDHKCRFGKALYGDWRKHAEKIVPDLAPVFKEIEKPHRLLHQSAIEIGQKMNRVNTAEVTKLFFRLDLACRNWVDKVISDVNDPDENVEQGIFSFELDHTKCILGKWLHGGKADALAKEYPKFAPVIKKLKKDHIALHKGGEDIAKHIKSQDFFGANFVINNKVRPSFKLVTGDLKEARDIVDKYGKDQENAFHILSTVAEKNLKQVEELLHNISEVVDKNMTTKEDLLNAARGAETTSTVIGIAALAIGIVLALFIVKELVSSLTKVANGMNEGAEQVASASGQVASSSQILASGSSEQASSLEETSASLEEMSSMTRQNAENAMQADSLMKEGNEVVARANETMEQLTVSMGDISKASEDTQNVVKTIDEIAFQTNLLALNAAVEAARAGEAGAGFAVVAEEVRNLALRSAEAAKNTAGLIEGTVKKVKGGFELVKTTSDAFAEVASSAAKVGELVGEIAAASKEQAQGIEQVNAAVTEMDKVTQQNAATAEESASVSEEMSAQAEEMKAMVGELLALVGGENARAKGKTVQVEKGEAKTAHAKKDAKRAYTPKHPVAREQEKRPEALIPFDDNDDEFADF